MSTQSRSVHLLYRPIDSNDTQLGEGDWLLPDASSRSPVVIPEHSAESLSALNVTTALADTILGLDQCVVQPLMISLHVVMLGELTNGATERLLAKENHPVDALIFG